MQQRTVRARRDRLVVLLMMGCALTVGELMGMNLASVQAHAGSLKEVAKQLSLTGVPFPQPESLICSPCLLPLLLRQQPPTTVAVGPAPGTAPAPNARCTHQQRPGRFPGSQNPEQDRFGGPARCRQHRGLRDHGSELVGYRPGAYRLLPGES